MLDMSSKANKGLGNRGYRIGLTATAQEVILVAVPALRLDLRGSDGYNVANLVSYHAFGISSTS